MPRDASWAYTQPRGVEDRDGPHAHTARVVEERVLGLARRYGYEPVQVPTFEYADLYHRDRVGEELFHGLVVARLSEGLDFPARRHRAGAADKAELVHEVALRPEFTAPIARMLVSRLLREGKPRHLPQRVSYAGSVFRDLRPRLPLRLREFRQVGVELFGCETPSSDLEVLLLACDAATELGLPAWELHLSHARLYQLLLQAAGVPEEDQRAVAAGLELRARLLGRMRGPDEEWQRYAAGFASDLRERLRLAELPLDHPALREPHAASAAGLREALPAAVDALLRKAWGQRGLGGSRAEHVLALAELQGDPDLALSALHARVADIGDAGLRGEAEGALGELAGLCSGLQSLRAPKLQLSPAASRGIAYYTGMTFEIHTRATEGPYTDVCGGGRYDQLHRWIYERARATRRLRGEHVAESAPPEGLLGGVGFAFGVERLVAAIGLLPDTGPRPVYVGVVDQARLESAFLLADRLRTAGLPAVPELMGPDAGQGVREQIGHASRINARYLLLLGGDEWERGLVVLRDMDARTQIALPVEDAARRLEEEDG